MNGIEKMKQLIKELNNASNSYYNKTPIMTDEKWDKLYDELIELENKLGIVFNNSPSCNVGYPVFDVLKEVKHNHLMLSLNKTKSIEDLRKFSNDISCVLSVKCDGLTTSLKYNDGKLISAETRGNGVFGTDVLQNVLTINNIPKEIPYKQELIIDGETIIGWDVFEELNKESSNNKYKHPRNLVSGSLQLLDSKEASKRNMRFVAWRVIKGFNHKSIYEDLVSVEKNGFEIVPMLKYDSQTDTIEMLSYKLDLLKKEAETKKIPYDGMVIAVEDYQVAEKMGKTDKFFRHSLAYKYKDDMYETKLENIEWSVSKSGLLNPVAVFSPVDLDGAITTRATLHNITYIKNLKLGVGDRIHVYRSNMVIPRVHDSIDKSDNITIPSVCPVCGGETKIVKENDSEVLVCANPDCQGKLLYKLSHFASRNALNIEGLSESTIQFLLKRKWVSCFKDLYHLKGHEIEWKRFPGFGSKSVTGILAAIEKSRETTLDRFLYGLSIPMVGKTASEMIAKACDYDFGAFMQIMTLTGAKFFNYLDGVGDSIIKSMDEYFNKECSNIFELSKEFNFNVPKVVNLSLSSEVSGKTFVITGSVEHFPNRDAVKDAIVNHGGKVVGSVSAKVDYLVNNDINSTSSKNKKAKELGVKIITEDELIRMLGD